MYSIACWSRLVHANPGKTTVSLELLCGRQLSLRSWQWHYPIEIILCPSPELISWHWAMGKCTRIDYQVWGCGRLSCWLPGWYVFPKVLQQHTLCCYIERTVRKSNKLGSCREHHECCIIQFHYETAVTPSIYPSWRLLINPVQLGDRANLKRSVEQQLGWELICGESAVDIWAAIRLTGQV